MLRTTSRSRSSRTVAWTSDSRAAWVMNTRRASGAVALLLGDADAHAVGGEHAGHRVQHAGQVGDVEAEQVLGRRLVDRADRGAR